MKERLRRFMEGRYGVDDLGRFLNILILLILVVSMFTIPAITFVGLALLVWQYSRMLSRSAYKRQQENMAYLRAKRKLLSPFAGLRQRFSQRKTHNFYKCPSCKQSLRVPKGKGTVSITCPKCQARFTKKT